MPKTPPASARSTPENPKANAAPAEAAPAKPVAPQVASASGDSDRVLTIAEGDTLSEIALRMVGQGVTMHQAMAAIYEANRSAFINNSVHLIKEGAIIRIPNRAAMRQRSKNEALILLAQNDGRNVYSSYAKQIGLLNSVGEQVAQPA
ncbi:MAG: DUF3235 domain-containing protein, partial [Limnobacter sp.]|nr:DUF3235 domain-containing protein [Limnobacter sp.]